MNSILQKLVAVTCFITLCSKITAVPQKTIEELPSSVFSWIESELENATVKQPMNLESDSLFVSLNARLVGYIRGYKPESGIETGLTYTYNTLTYEAQPVLLHIHPDGRFEATIPMQYPYHSDFKLSDANFSFYLEPGQTLGMYIDYDDFPGGNPDFRKIVYLGPLADINTELNLYLPKRYEYDYNHLDKKALTQLPGDFKKEQAAIYEKDRATIDRLVHEKKL